MNNSARLPEAPSLVDIAGESGVTLIKALNRPHQRSEKPLRELGLLRIANGGQVIAQMLPEPQHFAVSFAHSNVPSSEEHGTRPHRANLKRSPPDPQAQTLCGERP